MKKNYFISTVLFLLVPLLFSCEKAGAPKEDKSLTNPATVADTAIVTLATAKIVTDFPAAVVENGSVLGLNINYYSIACKGCMVADSAGTYIITVNGSNLVVSLQDSVSGSNVWLTRVKDENECQLVRTEANSNLSDPANLSVAIDTAGACKQETFHLHGYILYYDSTSQTNKVYHVNIDPKVRGGAEED